ncbi:hypothetical protein DF185_21590 [Marinifilum breve]|uniref:DUF5050 domain-containing protein n=1 Tax=Marinifilum breve TaxID=2184082 RepID=A0A2V3ZQS6_9BACT|nr:hypothetical protein [Marinifilum breve]PXX95693.1 hypothetical protein DF185_21590 [Marinifilum breve]
MQILLIWFLSVLNLYEPTNINTPCDFFEIDHMGNVYVVNGSQLSKYNSEGEQVCNFSDSSLGSISSIDVSDPLRILLFYRDFNQIIYLNNKLSTIGNEIDLYDISDNETEFVCNSQKGGFWMYNSIENQATYITNNGEIAAQTILLGSFFEDAEIVKMFEHNSDLYLLYENKGILQLDQNGQFVRKLSFQDIQDFQLIGKQIYYQDKTGIHLYQALNQSDQLIHTKEDPSREIIQCTKDKIFIKNENSISIKTLSF